MGFMDAMKGANNSWGLATADFLNGIAYIGPENMVDNRNHTLMLSGTGIEKFTFGKDDVARAEVIAATSSWVKYRIVLKDGKEIIATLRAMMQGQKGADIAMTIMNVEWWLAGVLYK